MLVTELGIYTDVKPSQPLKALLPMLVTEYVLPPKLTLEGIVSVPVGLVYPLYGILES